MAGTLTSFLVGIGFDFDRRGAKEIDSSIDSIKRTALQAGSAVAGAFGIKKLTRDFAVANDELGKFSEVFGVLPGDVFALGAALAQEGGTLAGFMSQIENLERLRARMLVNDFSFIPASGIAGLDPSVIINAENATEAYVALADQFQRMTSQQRLNAAEALGLDEASIRLLSQGSDAVESQVSRFRGIRPVTTDMTEQAAEFNREWKELWMNAGAITDEASNVILPKVTGIVAGINDWADANRKLIREGSSELFETVADNLGLLVGAAIALKSAGVAGILNKIGSAIPAIAGGASGLATAAKALGAVGAAYAAYEVVSGASQGGRFSATSLFGQSDFTTFLDTPIGDFFPGTVVTPQDVAPITQPVSSVISAMNQAMTAASMNSAPRQRILAPIRIQIGNKELKELIIEVNDEQDEQALKDIRSPMEK